MALRLTKACVLFVDNCSACEGCTAFPLTEQSPLYANIIRPCSLLQVQIATHFIINPQMTPHDCKVLLESRSEKKR